MSDEQNTCAEEDQRLFMLEIRAILQAEVNAIVEIRKAKPNGDLWIEDCALNGFDSMLELTLIPGSMSDHITGVGKVRWIEWLNSVKYLAYILHFEFNQLSFHAEGNEKVFLSFYSSKFEAHMYLIKVYLDQEKEKTT